MIGKRYKCRGELVRVLVKWGPGRGPRNVLIEYLSDGRGVVRPFRGLRKLLLLSILLSLSTSLVTAQNIATKVLTAGTPIKVSLSPALTTTLLFPAVPSGTFGLGLVGQAGNAGAGSVQIEHPDGSQIVVLHALNETAAVIMTVLMDGQLYVFDLRSAPQPDVAVTLLKADAAAPRAVEVTPEEVRAARIKYDPELLVGFLRRAHNAPLMRKLYPDLYQGYNSRTADYTSDSVVVRTTVTQIHRFSKEDALVLEGTVQNEGGAFDHF